MLEFRNFLSPSFSVDPSFERHILGPGTMYSALDRMAVGKLALKGPCHSEPTGLLEWLYRRSRQMQRVA